MRKRICQAALALAYAMPAMAATAPPPGAQTLGAAQKAGEALEISNIMGRYSVYVVANEWAAIGNLFALDEPDVRQNVPAYMEGPAVRAYFTKRQAAPLKDGVMHQHSFLAPLIEVAGDGRTAKGVWDSPGLDTGDGDGMANWAWVRYAIDFKKIGDSWKIWHLRVLPVWRAPYGQAWSDMVKGASGGRKSGGGGAPAVSGAKAEPRPAAMAGAPPAGRSERGWRYNGLGAPPMLPLKLPEPYYSFDPADAY